MYELDECKQGAHAVWEHAVLAPPTWYLAPSALLEPQWLNNLEPEEFRLYHYLLARPYATAARDFDVAGAAKDLHTTPVKLMEGMAHLARLFVIQLDVHHNCGAAITTWPPPALCPQCQMPTIGCLQVKFRTVHAAAPPLQLQVDAPKRKPKKEKAPPTHDRAALNDKIMHFSIQAGIPKELQNSEFWKQWGVALRQIEKRLEGTPYKMPIVEATLSDYFQMGYPFDQPHIFVNHIVEAVRGELKPFRRGAVRVVSGGLDEVSTEGNTTAADLLKRRRQLDPSDSIGSAVSNSR